jgi:putative ubiquitin-RnfH superfamily antitoxin RatB of RatAB toxin-antitoxin module
MRRADPSLLRVTVVYVRPNLTFECQLRLKAPASVGEAIEASGILSEIAELQSHRLEVGVFSRRCAPSELLHDGDRVEVYRPLALDPKQARRRRAALRRKRNAARPAGG